MKTKTILRSILGLFALVAIFTANAAPETVLNSTSGLVDSPDVAPAMAMALAMNELAEKELIKHFRHAGSWLGRVPSKNKWVNNDVIKLTEIGADPTVLINNTTYPIAVSQRTDDSVPVSLYKYDTENTKVTDDEMYGLPYDKIDSVQRQHRETLEEKTEAHALHSLAPAADSTETPIFTTTGELDGTRRRLRSQDLVNYKKQLDVLKIAAAGRILVLSADHIADLLLEDKALNLQYQNHKEGAITKKYYGFEIYESLFSPRYTAAKAKIPFDDIVTEGEEASVLFHAKHTAKARGTVKRYFAKSENDPQNRESLMGFRLYFLAIPTRKLGQGAIVNGVA